MGLLRFVFVPLVADALNSNGDSLFYDEVSADNALLKEFDNQHEIEEFKNDILSGKLNVGVMFFYANWCPHCQRFKPIFNAATTKNEELIKDHKVGYRTMDCAVATCPPKPEVSGYPTLKLYFPCNKMLRSGGKVCELDISNQTRKNGLVRTMPEVILQLADERTRYDARKALQSENKRLEDNPEEELNIIESPRGPKWDNEYLDATPKQMLYDTWQGAVEAIGYLFLHAEDQNNLPDPLWQSALEFVDFYQKYSQNKSIKQEFQNLKTFMEELGNPINVEDWKAKIREYVDEANKRLIPFDWLGESNSKGFRKSPSCNNFTCRMWHGFHTTAEGIPPEERKAMYEHLHNFRKNFFGCKKCRKHMKTYLEDKVNTDNEDKLTPAEYMFRFHETVTASNLKDKPIDLYPSDYEKFLPTSKAHAFPPPEKCPKCLDDDEHDDDDDDDDDASNYEEIKEFLQNLYVDNNAVIFKSEELEQEQEQSAVVLPTDFHSPPNLSDAPPAYLDSTNWATLDESTSTSASLSDEDKPAYLDLTNRATLDESTSTSASLSGEEEIDVFLPYDWTMPASTSGRFLGLIN